MGGGISNKARVSFAKSGKISFSKAACELMGLKKADKLSLAQDDAHPDKWYFFKDEAGFALLEIKAGGILLFHKALVNEFTGSWDLDPEKSHRVTIQREPVRIGSKLSAGEYWLIEVSLPE